MNKIWIIARRELASYFDSLIAYVMIIIFLGMSGFFTWLFGSNIFMINQASLKVFFGISFWTLFFFIPAITMRTLAEENKSGTIELLSTKAVSDFQIVVGKFLGCLLLVAIALLCTLPYYITVSQLGNVDHGGIIGGYLGLILLSAAYIGIGLFASSTTSNQIVAFLMALFIGIFFQILFDVLGSSFRGAAGGIFYYLSMQTHFDSMSRGVIDSRDLIYFGSLIAISLLLSQAMLSRRNWQS
ncbi:MULTISPECIES: ABC transporter permease [unclassified Imperialibacter]|uniref:ABC transporter permease n=1 Tax=unclassified Imperialibacter TaxID=2629706 RepID=UPI0012539EA6|nr:MULTISPECIES: ABC transporter permease [unclassified Imperialibacter]CAD5267547.1 ABC-2 type transport system permease protein [Imperialibacter sp. 75]CAD5279887.1 ABC-2 type transport system permease protein [Imperialibacter sp. 89]VVT01108.1 ABC-2 type transport system permease protein [Imperialibacter sp. EC-SDR9]